MSNVRIKFSGFYAPTATSPAKEIVFRENNNDIDNAWLPIPQDGFTGKLEIQGSVGQEYFTQKTVEGEWDGRMELVMSRLNLQPDPSGSTKLVNLNTAEVKEMIFDDLEGWHISHWEVRIIDKIGNPKDVITPGAGDLICDILTWQNTVNPALSAITKQAWPHYP
ncbi:MAG: hypothetical protein GW763_12770 [Paraglaciecola sp.]|nr:hypothetical protein [Paraglaciecola sp.]NCT48833.1 hypothetical protein [Paraglaciecola sp.]